MKKNMQTA